MSYARWGEGSDVYVFLNVGGYLECCSCSLNDGGVQYMTTDAMLAHLEAHRQKGHSVPDYCIEGLTEDRDDNDNWIRMTWDTGYTCGRCTPYGRGRSPSYEHFFTVLGYRPMEGVKPSAALRILGRA